ncbi:glycosyltransferase family 4 protein [Dokdonella immobilis]|uniref:Uncharacterized protein n=1 Tax=Dokdonella immobilis TaxID=578942 RepID=A0A1I4Y2R6_9GAMM|nr:glycosyltransferase family 4 protein [Dokdonella immobilis]SFN31789.1 hypothetical protein SAMN05216289_11410 [Dokdonella immobilis]
MSDRPIRGAYVARLDLSQPHLKGVAEKIRGQRVALAKELGGPVRLIYPVGASILLDEQVAKHFGYGALRRRLTYYLFFYLAVPRLLGVVEYIYLRYQGCSPLMLWMLWRVRRSDPSIKILIEIPSFPYDNESQTLREKAKQTVDRLFRGMLWRLVDRIVTFSHQTSIFRVPTIRTDNGVDPARWPLSANRDRSAGLRLLGLANLSRWHGYDRVITGLSRYYENGGKHHVFFDVVGSGAESMSLQELAAAEGVEKFVRFWGPQSGQELEGIVALTHIGISSLGIHRVMMDSSTIKAREYCARGLPFVLGFKDPDFAGNLPFVFHAPASEEPLDIAAVQRFYEKLVSDNPKFGTDMRTYAERNLTWQNKMQPICDYICQPQIAET